MTCEVSSVAHRRHPVRDCQGPLISSVFLRIFFLRFHAVPVLPVFHKFMAKFLEEDTDGNINMVRTFAIPPHFRVLVRTVAALLHNFYKSLFPEKK